MMLPSSMLATKQWELSTLLICILCCIICPIQGLFESLLADQDMECNQMRFIFQLSCLVVYILHSSGCSAWIAIGQKCISSYELFSLWTFQHVIFSAYELFSLWTFNMWSFQPMNFSGCELFRLWTFKPAIVYKYFSQLYFIKCNFIIIIITIIISCWWQGVP